MLKETTITLALLAAGYYTASAQDPLLFPKDSFKIESKVVGDKKVVYRSYKHITYVANPVDKDYQSLDVRVPVSIDGKVVDASNAPILFSIGVGGYMSVNNMREDFGGFPPGGMPADGPPPGAGNMGGGPPPGGGSPGGFHMPAGGGMPSKSNTDLALAEGFVVVSPGCRGRDNKAADGTYYGKAPAAIVDLKAAVRYIRHNKGVLPGDAEHIISTGVSAGGALSGLLAASGNSALYEPYLKEIGAADAPDNIYASACFCPITDLDHADGAYEWMYGDKNSDFVKAFAQYQEGLHLQGKDGFGVLNADNYGAYLVKYYLAPSFERYISKLDKQQQQDYLKKNSWITYKNKKADFSFSDYVKHVGRMKGTPAFDDFKLQSGENSLFGNETTNARHFTAYKRSLDSDIAEKVFMMNAMNFIQNKDCAQYWWLRQGSSDAHTSQTVLINLATTLENQHKEVNTALYWDAGHGADEDAEEFIKWVHAITQK
jgi:hypothetical protein